MDLRIGQTSSLAHEAIAAALKKQARAAAEVQRAAEGVAPAVEAQESPKNTFEDALARGLRAIDGAVKSSEALPSEMVAGQVTDFHEIAARIKQTDLTFKFALEVRNKLIDAYREVMRMSV